MAVIKLSLPILKLFSVEPNGGFIEAQQKGKQTST